MGRGRAGAKLTLVRSSGVDVKLEHYAQETDLANGVGVKLEPVQKVKPSNGLKEN
jgi:hypothetical protein